MKKTFLLLFLAMGSIVKAQFDISGGMGISYFNSAALVDYINVNFAGRDEVKTFNSSVEFFTEGDYEVTPEFQIGFEYAFSLYSYNNNYGPTYYDISISYHKPSVLAYYVIPGEGYKFKFGGGIGYRFSSVTEKNITENDYSSGGIGLLLRTQAFTTLGDNVYAMIGFDARYDHNGEPSDGDYYLLNNIDNSKVDLNLISFAFKIGIAYFIN